MIQHDGKVRLLRVERRMAVWNCAGEISRMDCGHVAISLSLPQQHRTLDGSQLKAPGKREEALFPHGPSRPIAAGLLEACDTAVAHFLALEECVVRLRKRASHHFPNLLATAATSGASLGANPPTTPTTRTRSGTSAPQASAYGEPADDPSTAKVSISRASTNPKTSFGQSTTRRPGRRSEQPIPGRSGMITRTPSSATAFGRTVR